MSMCHLHVDTCGGQQRVADPLDLELQEVVSHMTLVPGNKLQLFARAISTLNYRDIFPSPNYYSFLVIHKCIPEFSKINFNMWILLYS